MIKAAFTIPKKKLQTIKVWAGVYGGHYDIIVFFKSKPVPSKEEHNYIDGQWYDCSENKDLIIGDMVLGQFKEYYPDAVKGLKPYLQDDLNEPGDGRPMEVEIPEVFEMEITTMIDEYGDMEKIDFHTDWP